MKYYATGYARYAIERLGISFSWLQNEEQSFNSKEEFIKFLRERENEKGEILYLKRENELKQFEEDINK